MTLRFLCLLSTVVSLFAISMSGEAHGKKKPSTKFTELEIQKAVVKAIGKPDFSSTSDQKFHFISRYANLDDKGNLELLVWAGCCGYGGTGGYQLLIFTWKSHKLNLLSVIDFVWTPIIIQKAKRKGWHDIVLQEGGGGSPFEFVVSHFTGKGYQVENLESIKQKRIKGKWLVGKRRRMTMLGPIPTSR